VVPVHDPWALADAIRELLEPEALAAAFRGAEAARRALTWDAAAEQHEAVYREVAR
jgi:glycosyltransferase involved in cell wall biosynthesis